MVKACLITRPNQPMFSRHQALQIRLCTGMLTYEEQWIYGFLCYKNKINK